MEENCGSKNKFDSTIMFGTSNNNSNYPKLSIFIEIIQIWYCHDMAAPKNNFNSTISSPHEITQRFNFHKKVDIFVIRRPFWKKMAACSKNFLIVPSCSSHQKQHIPIWITSLANILWDIKCPSGKIRKKTH